MSRVQLEQISVKPMKSGKYNDFYPIGIKVDGAWYNGVAYIVPNWKAGDMLDVELYEEEYQGKTYKKFKIPKYKPGQTPIDPKEDKPVIQDDKDVKWGRGSCWNCANAALAPSYMALIDKMGAEKGTDKYLTGVEELAEAMVERQKAFVNNEKKEEVLEPPETNDEDVNSFDEVGLPF